MAWNRKRRVRLARGLWMGRLVVVSVVVACLSLWFVWLKVQMVDLGYQIRDMEKKLSGAKKENQVLRMKISQMKSPGKIEAILRAKEMNLTATKSTQVVMLPLYNETGPGRTLVPHTRGPLLLEGIKQSEPPGRIPRH